MVSKHRDVFRINSYLWRRQAEAGSNLRPEQAPLSDPMASLFQPLCNYFDLQRLTVCAIHTSKESNPHTVTLKMNTAVTISVVNTSERSNSFFSLDSSSVLWLVSRHNIFVIFHLL